MPHFGYGGHRLAYTVYGEGAPTVLMPGLLLSQKMQGPLAHSLAKCGNQVITFDPLGHGASDRPRQMWRYSIPEFAKQAVALLDHLGLDEAVVGGTSLGANISLELGATVPERLRGLLFALTFGEPVVKAVARVARALPRSRAPFLIELALDAIAQEPGPSAAVLQGILFGRTAPDHLIRPTIETPALVIGHPRDPIHPFSDADMLAAELPNARLIDANSIIELRTHPKRLTAKIAEFIEGCWKGGAKASAGRGRAASA